MALANLRMYLDTTPATEEQLDLFREIRVELAEGMAGEAELEIELTLDDQGLWSTIEEEFSQAFRRIRIETRMGEGEFTPLIEGSIVAQRFSLAAGPGKSLLTLVVHDDSILLNQSEDVAMFEDQTPDQIAETLITGGGLTAEVESVPAAGSSYTRYVVQRGTAMQLLRGLARQHAMHVYVKPDTSPGRSIGVFARPSMVPGEAGELLLIGDNRNIETFSVHLDALQPTTARAGEVRLSDNEILDSESDSPSLDPLGSDGLHDALQPKAKRLLSETREEQNDLDAATGAAVDQSSFAYTATTEVDSNNYNYVLSPYQVIRVAGPGGFLGGNYFISRVQHVINCCSYKQSLTLKRNARSGGSTSSSTSKGVF
jgi:hypothetical protein